MIVKNNYIPMASRKKLRKKKGEINELRRNVSIV
jgi:hypothetical protein